MPSKFSLLCTPERTFPGFDEKRAEGLTETMRAAIDESELVTKTDLQIEIAPIKADLTLLKWMMGALIAIAVANFSKQFF